jgi:geranylgeranyl diphosphate synthase type II
VVDLESEGKPVTRATLKFIHLSKTAALLTSSLRLGAMSANATPSKLQALTDFGRALGLAFQVIDDILDVTQTTEKLGKTAGKDAAVTKATYPALFGLKRARTIASELTHEALEALRPFGKRAALMRSLAESLLVREY